MKITVNYHYKQIRNKKQKKVPELLISGLYFAQQEPPNFCWLLLHFFTFKSHLINYLIEKFKIKNLELILGL